MGVRCAASCAAGALAIAVLAGCGSSSKPLSKADYIAKADAICKQTNTDIVAATKNLKHPSTTQIIDTTKSKLVPLLKKQDAELAKLEPPVADKVTIETFLRELKAVTTDVDLHTAAFVKAHGASQIATAASGLAHDYGFKVCAKIG